MGFPMELLKKGMGAFKKKVEGSPAEEAGESKQFEAGEKEGSKEYKGKKPAVKGVPKKKGMK